MSKEKIYELVGFMNMFRVVPDLVYPVFKGDDEELYLVDASKDDFKIKNFIRIKEAALSHVIFFKDGITTNEINSKDVTNGSDFIFILQVKENELQVGDIKSIGNYLKNFKTDNEILMREINNILKKLE